MTDKPAPPTPAPKSSPPGLAEPRAPAPVPGPVGLSAADPSFEQQQKLQAVGQLAGGIAHDFNNLLTAILGTADLILRRADTSAETASDLHDMCAAVERGAALVRHLLAFSRQQTLQPRVVAVNPAVAAAASLLRRLLGERITLDLALEQPGRAVLIDPGQLDQVLINLAVNARDAMPKGGVLALATGHATIYAPRPTATATIPPGRYVTISVGDTGTGIPPDILPRIFEPFFTTRRTQGGSGLGLSTVLGIVRQSDGFLEVDSASGRGTRIVLYLPRHRVEMASPATVTAAPIGAGPCAGGAGRVVLVAEDEALVRRTLTRALTRAGWQVLAAETGEATLALVRAAETRPESQPVVVVADVVMPGMDGVTLVRELRLLWPGLPAVLVSGYADQALREALVSTDIAYLSKPYETAELLATVARLADPSAGGAPASAAP